MKNILMLLLFLSSTLTAKESLEDNKMTLLLPVDWTTEKHLNLIVNIPENYKPVQPVSVWDKTNLIEFIPKEEEVSDWTEIITVQKLINSGISAHQITQALLDNLAKIAKISVLFQENSDKKYQEDTLIVKYKFNNKDEILGTKYLSGPYDTVGVQYTIRLKEKQSQNEAVEKIKDFFLKNLNLLESDKKSS